MTRPVDSSAFQPTADRLLLAVELIARNGPLTADMLREQMDLPKTVVWRLIQKLKESGWIRLRNGGHLIELNARLDELFATAHFADREFSAVGDVTLALAAAGRCHIDLFVPDHAGQVQLQDTSRRLTGSRPTLDGSDEFILQVIRAANLLQDSRLSGVRKSRAMTDTGRAEEAFDPLDPGLIRSGFIWDYDRMALYVALLGRMGTPAAIRIAPKTRTPRPEILCVVFEGLRRDLRSHVAAFGKQGQTPIAFPTG